MRAHLLFMHVLHQCVGGERESVVYIDLEGDGVSPQKRERWCVSERVPARVCDSVREDECMRAPLLFVYVLNLEYKCMCVTSTYREMVCAEVPRKSSV